MVHVASYVSVDYYVSSLVGQKPHLAPRVVLMARPINEGLVSNAYR